MDSTASRSSIVVLALTISLTSVQANPMAADHIKTRREIAIGVNPPIGWLVRAFAVSGYAQLSDHHGMRVNAASFPNPHFWAAPALAGDGGASGGSVFDVGAGWTYYPRRFLDGFGTELGAFYRRRDVRDFYDGLGDSYEWKTRIVAARALVSWNWRIRSSIFISLAVGASTGNEKGTQRSQEEPMSAPRSVDRQVFDIESYLRLGYAFGI